MADLLDELVDNMNGVGEAGDGLELPEDLGEAGAVAGDVAWPGAALGKAGGMLPSGDEDLGQAVGEVEGRRMGVMTGGGQEGIDVLTGAVESIGLLGLPVKGAILTAAVGSKL